MEASYPLLQIIMASRLTKAFETTKAENHKSYYRDEKSTEKVIFL